MKYPESQTPPDEGQGIWSSALITTLRVVIDWRDKYCFVLEPGFYKFEPLMAFPGCSLRVL